MAIDSSLGVAFERQVAKTPCDLAVVSGDAALSYESLNEKANRVANFLLSRGIGPEDTVALLLPRSVNAVVSILGTLKAGASYLPIDPLNPAERVADIMRDAAPAFVITSGAFGDKIAADRPRLIWDTPESVRELARYETSNPVSLRRRQALTGYTKAYVIYTSGSTGIPKAVVGLHCGVMNRLSWFHDTFAFQNERPTLARSSPSFIDATTELLGPLLHGGRVVLAPPDVGGDPKELAVLIQKHNIGVITLTPSLLGLLLIPDLVEQLRVCKLWISSGEALPKATALRFRELLPGAHLINLYGCSEASGDSLFEDRMEEAGSIGCPIWNTRVYLLGEELAPVLVDTRGELYLAGVGLARGYLGRPGLTAERFVADPFGPPGSRMYRTGDLALRRPDERIEFVGRSDNQVKIRGIRVELREVEAMLRRYLPVSEVLVIAQDDQYAEKRLIGYIVSATEPKQSGNRLRTMLQEFVPSYMIPAIIVVLERMPHTITGKIDQRALPPPEIVTTSGQREPLSPDELALCRIFADVLGLDHIGVEDNFSEMGGHSLLATRIVSRVRADLNVECSIAKLFEAKTVAGLAERLRIGEKISRPQLKARG
jgi:amino acid adenylation domain-containing protein